MDYDKQKRISENQVLFLHGYNSSPKSHLEQTLQNFASNIFNSAICHTPCLAGHSIEQKFISKDATIPNIMEKGFSDLDSFEKNSGNKYIVATSTGANPVLNWLQMKKRKINGVFLIKPLTDLEYGVSEFNKQYGHIIQQLFDKNFYDFLKLEEHKESQGGTLTGTISKPFQINGNIPICIVCGENDITAGNRNFIKQRLNIPKPELLTIIELTNSKHGYLRENETEEIYDIMQEFIRNNYRA